MWSDAASLLFPCASGHRSSLMSLSKDQLYIASNKCTTVRYQILALQSWDTHFRVQQAPQSV